jgi:hypothetical protein
MNIKDTINELELQEVRLPRILNQRVNTVIDLQKKVELAESEVTNDDSEENKEKLQEIKDYLNEYFNDAVEQLKSFAKKYKSNLEQEAKQKETKTKEPKVQVSDTKNGEEKEKEKSSSGGLGALLIGGVILVATLGAVNIMKNKN